MKHVALRWVICILVATGAGRVLALPDSDLPDVVPDITCATALGPVSFKFKVTYDANSSNGSFWSEPIQFNLLQGTKGNRMVMSIAEHSSVNCMAKLRTEKFDAYFAGVSDLKFEKLSSDKPTEGLFEVDMSLPNSVIGYWVVKAHTDSKAVVTLRFGGRFVRGKPPPPSPIPVVRDPEVTPTPSPSPSPPDPSQSSNQSAAGCVTLTIMAGDELTFGNSCAKPVNVTLRKTCIYTSEPNVTRDAAFRAAPNQNTLIRQSALYGSFCPPLSGASNTVQITNQAY